MAVFRGSWEMGTAHERCHQPSPNSGWTRKLQLPDTFSEKSDFRHNREADGGFISSTKARVRGSDLSAVRV
jgi:hypothetical protein